MRVIRIMGGVRRLAASWLTTYRQGPRPNIAIFALRRGGSAMLAEMLGSERGLLHVDEPFDVFKAGWNTARLKWLKPRPHNEFFDLNDEERRSVRAFLSALADGRTGLGVCRNPKFPFRADRMLLEIVHAPALLDWLAESFGLQVVRLLRHPAPQVLSVLRAGGRIGAGVYFERPNFLRGFLGEDQLEFGSRILAGRSPWPIGILDWCIRYHLLVHFSKRATPLITHEELVLDPLATIRSLREWLDLSGPERAAGADPGPSSSSGGEFLGDPSHTRDGDPRSPIASWLGEVDAAQAAQAQEILDRFGVSFYNMSDPLPVDRPAAIGACRPATSLEDGARGQPALARPEPAPG